MGGGYRYLRYQVQKVFLGAAAGMGINGDKMASQLGGIDGVDTCCVVSRAGAATSIPGDRSPGRINMGSTDGAEHEPCRLLNSYSRTDPERDRQIFFYPPSVARSPVLFGGELANG